MRTFDDTVFMENGIERKWIQENHSRSEKKGIIRGMHCQLQPYSETKLVRCIIGAIYDVFIDLRKDSKTFGQWDSVILTAENKKMIFIPRGFAHGFCSLTDISEVVYKVDNFYNKETEIGILWNDHDIGIQWPIKKPKLSIKDNANITFRKFHELYKDIEI